MKSERAKQYLLKVVTPIAMMYPDCPEECDLKLGEAKRAVELAEQETEERMKRKAVEAFEDIWLSGMEPDNEELRKRFIKKLNEA